MTERVLVAYDGTPLADRALEYALETFPDADVSALYVVEMPEGHLSILGGPEIRLPLTEKAREYAEETVEKAEETANERGRDIHTDIATGKPDRRVLARAEDDEIDTIVVGSHGRKASRFLLGSVAEAIVHRSPIPVVVVR